MTSEPLPRNRKVVTNPGQHEVPPEKDFIKPIIETRRVITGFIVGERQTKAIKERKTLIEKICEKYPQVTREQLGNSQIAYCEFHAKVELNQYSPVSPRSKR